jgi:hypothetical protein
MLNAEKLFQSATLALLIAAGSEHPAPELKAFQRNIQEFTKKMQRNPLAVRGGRARARSAQRDKLGRFLPHTEIVQLENCEHMRFCF